MTNAIFDDQVIEADTARREVGIGRDQWNRVLRSGDLPVAKIGRRRYVRRSDLRDYIDAQFN
ncbi:helix-turn-helix domain-containing protein [Gordonia sp. (in: high G+C Gram-positive bacteria)]|uniref:helix-turn-helix domain-containing protein n=1 Tax=Gordonia sp. (in: high G+C Gram-positive bacteria) TaxID=84139 RepID=UPI0039E2DF6A